ncbi:pitrilysin family protein [Bowmanella denitrificans]|uniref:Pitrilysin family protein n=1 Tax=Bowmanella denitrificans TaxID=366582 RepID=A0ABN0WXF3_9ALTE
MKLNKLVIALSIAGLAACSSTPTGQPVGSQLVEQVSAVGNELVIPYKKFQLVNGLTLIVHEDHSDPLVHVDVTYHVGSAREELGKSGFAHFFEHMMFQGSEHVGDDEHFKIVTEAGGTMNGTTNSDRTNYFQTVPVNQLETMLWLEADRMGFLLNAVTQEKFEIQRETVKNERGQRIDNQPYGRLGERVAQALYPEGHPYSWPVIGWMDDLNRVNVNDLKAFFLRWYGPNNATLTIGGDVKAEEVLALVEKYFGSIPRGPEVQPMAKPTVSLDKTRYISMEDNVHLPLVYIAYPTVHLFHADEAPLDVLMQIIGSGNNSLLYQNLVKNQLAVQAAASHGCSELACQFALYALPHPASGKTLADMEAVIRNSLAEFEQRGVTDDDLAKIKAEMLSDAIFGLQSVHGKVAQLANYQTLLDNPNYINEQVARYRRVSKEDVMRVYEKYIKGKASVVMSVVPKGQTQLVAAADNFSLPAPVEMGPSTTTADDLHLRVAKDNFDRSVRPTPGANPAVDVPQYWQENWGNGIEVLGTHNDETPTTSLLLKIRGGNYQQNLDKAGVTSILAAMLTESTKSRSSEQMARELEKLGSSIRVSAKDDTMNVFVNSLSENLPATLTLLEEYLFEPAFSQDDFARIQKQSIEGVKNAQKDAGYLASKATRALMYGHSVAGLPDGGTEQTLANITLDDVKAFYHTWFKPQGGEMILVSSLDKAKVFAAMPKLTAWQGSAPDVAPSIGKAQFEPGVIYLVNKDEAAQSAIRVAKPGLVQDITGEFYRTNLMNFPLGGAFNSRINMNLREDKGYTYGAWTGFWGDKYSGTFSASADVRADATKASLEEIYKEIGQYAQSGIRGDELSFMRLAINQKDALKYETPSAKLGFLAQILEFDLKPSFVKERAGIVSSISQAEINALAAKHLKLDEMLTVVVGDAKTLKPELEKLGKKVVEYKL